MAAEWAWRRRCDCFFENMTCEGKEGRIKMMLPGELIRENVIVGMTELTSKLDVTHTDDS